MAMGHDFDCGDVLWVLCTNELRPNLCRSSASCRRTTISSDALDIPSKRAQAGILSEIRESFSFCFQSFCKWISEPCFVTYGSTMCFLMWAWNSPSTCAHRWWYREGPLRALPWAFTWLPGLQRWKIITKGDDGAICADHRSCAPAKNRWLWKWCGMWSVFFCRSLDLARNHKHLMGWTFRCKFEH